MNATEFIKGRYNRLAKFYDYVDRIIGREIRWKVISQAKGKILEVGVGTGMNLPLYPPGSDLTGIDFSREKLKGARARAEKLGKKVRFIEMDAQELDFPDHSFDTVIATCVFCTVPDPVKGLKEIKRVLRPDGKAILLEHVRSDKPLMGAVMDILNPLAMYLIGDNINRDTVANVRKAGLKITSVSNIKGDILKMISAGP